MRNYSSVKKYCCSAWRLKSAFIICLFTFFITGAAARAEQPSHAAVETDTIRILAIGNSFSQDAVEFYLHGLAHAAHIPVVIANLSIGGASLALHWDCASNNKPAYSYRIISADGHKTYQGNVTMAEALSDQDWDYISFQQVSQHSGMFETLIDPLPRLYQYVREKIPERDLKFLFHQTWAYARDATHGGFKNYNRDQMTMYRAIVDVSQKVSNLIPIDQVIPAGTAIQNGRTSVIGDHFCRDGFHLDLYIGRYTAAATWFEALFGRTVIGNPFKPSALSVYEAEIAQHAAHAAIKKPFEITELVDYKHQRNPN